MDANAKCEWRVALYSWELHRSRNALLRLGVHSIECDHRPSADDIRKRINLKVTPAALVGSMRSSSADLPTTITAWNDDIIPLCESALSIMARLSK